MKDEAATAAVYNYSGVSYDRIQMLTIRDILEHKQEFHTPSKMGAKGRTGQYSLRL
jgi:hypothetical protein